MNARPSLILVAFLFPACTTLPQALKGEPSEGDGLRQELAAPKSAGDALGAIARLEDARSDGGGMLCLLAGHSDASVRARALRALGRLPLWRYKQEITQAIVAGLADEVALVRAEAAFALGMRADPSAEEGLLAQAKERDPLVRARLVEAASKIATPALQEFVLNAMWDEVEEVRSEAAQGVHRFPQQAGTAKDPQLVDGALLDLLERETSAQKHDPELRNSSSVVWQVYASLARRKADAARAAFLAAARNRRGSVRWERFFALKGLAELALKDPGDREIAALAAELAGEEDWILAAEAVRILARLTQVERTAALEVALAHPSSHVRLAALRALAEFPRGDQSALALSAAATLDPSLNVQAGAWIARAKLGEELNPDQLDSLASAQSAPILRRALAGVAAELQSERALPYLLALTHDDSAFVSSAAVAALGRHPPSATRGRLLELLMGADNGLRLASAEVLLELKQPPTPQELHLAFERSLGDIGSEARVLLLRLCRQLSQAEQVRPLLELALADPDPYVRLTGFRLGAELGIELALPAATTDKSGSSLRANAAIPSRGPNPRVVIETTRGLLEAELFPAEAPEHVRSFLELLRRDHYDGLSFHRVEPGFVVQGGCHRGDGNGGGSSSGAALRHEISPRKYMRGSMGMPRNDDFESGGSQFFITHVPTPHLDGRYTIFAELRSGLEVLDELEVGDRILDIRVR